MAGHRMAAATVDESGLVGAADLLRLPAAGAKTAARRRLDGQLAVAEQAVRPVGTALHAGS